MDQATIAKILAQLESDAGNPNSTIQMVSMAKGLDPVATRGLRFLVQLAVAGAVDGLGGHDAVEAATQGALTQSIAGVLSGEPVLLRAAAVVELECEMAGISPRSGVLGSAVDAAWETLSPYRKTRR